MLGFIWHLLWAKIIFLVELYLDYCSSRATIWQFRRLHMALKLFGTWSILSFFFSPMLLVETGDRQFLSCPITHQTHIVDYLAQVGVRVLIF